MKKYFFILTLIIMVMAPTILLHADDTAIYGSGSISVEPNILIIFDTSGSMSIEDVPSAYYDSATTYSGSYPSDAVYHQTWVRVYGRWRYRWVLYADDVNDFTCIAVKDALKTAGQTQGAVYETNSGDYACGGSNRPLQMGNYRNYEASVGGSMNSRIDVAKTVIKSLLEDTQDVKFGLMRFNSNQGGRVIKAVQSVTGDEAYRSELVARVGGLTASGSTPLAETLAEAGLYFAGKQSWFNGTTSYSDDVLTASNTYATPMDYRCQKNYIILMTDGEPTSDNDWKLKSGTYINGDTIGDYDNDGNSGDSTSDSSSDYLDDVAQYLYTNDCNPELGTGDLTFETQNIITYTIGFQTDQQLLEDTAQNGGGTYYNVSSISGLSNAFKTILSQIKEVNASYVAPVIPVSDMNQAYSGDFLYLGFFMPADGGRWLGNVKKYGINADGDILDANGIEATNTNGTIKDNALSYWSNGADGPDVTKGGLGELLLDNTNRKLYTYLGSNTALTDTTNLFSTSNSDLTYTELDVANNTEKDNVITDIIGLTSDWKMGDIIHSQPLVVGYDTTGDDLPDESYIFVGTNGGLMHAFKDSDGSEVWGFIPREHLSRLKLLSDNTQSHDYYMDAPPVFYDDGTNKTLFFGERRGGHNYQALDITNPAAPVYKYTISQDILASVDSDIDGNVDGAGVNLGQSWTSPTVHKIKTGINSYEEVFLMAGGYDENQDLDIPVDHDTKGKAVFAIDVTDGSLSALNFNSVNSSMTHCITDVMGYDFNEDGYTDRVYAGDLYGNIWAFEDEDADANDSIIGGDGTWSGRKLFSNGGLISTQRKIFYSPDVVLEVGEDMIFFGTGDRADPEETSVVNRIYAIRNNWEDSTSTSFTPLTEADLVDVTDNLIQVGTDVQKQAVKTALDTKRGWFFELENPGEKIISSVLVINEGLYFTTYEPESADAIDPADPCGEAGGLGIARLYTVNYKTGGAMQDYDDSIEKDAEGNIVTHGKKDRSMIIGTSIPSGVVAAVTPTGVNLFVGIGGGIIKVPPIKNLNMNRFYWRQR